MSSLIKNNHVTFAMDAVKVDFDPIEVEEHRVSHSSYGEQEKFMEEFEALKLEKKGLEDAIEEAKIKAENILIEAETKSQEMMHQSKMSFEAEMEILKEKIENDAREEGYQAGYQKAQEDATNMLDAASRELAQVKNKRIELVDDMQGKINSLIHQICSKILGYEIKDYSMYIIYMIRKALLEADERKGITLTVSYKCKDTIEENMAELVPYLDEEEMEIVYSPSLEQGDCIIETPHGSIDLSLDCQLSALKKHLEILG